MTNQVIRNHHNINNYLQSLPVFHHKIGMTSTHQTGLPYPASFGVCVTDKP